MLSVRELEPRVYELTLSGLVEKSDIDAMRRELTPALQAEGRMGLVVRAEDLHDMTGDALAEDARFEFAMLSQWSKISRVAVVTDKQAFAAILRWAGPILPMIDTRTFAPSEVKEAERWAAQGPETGAGAEGPGARVVEDGSDGLLVFEIAGTMSKDDVGGVFEAFDRAVEMRRDKIDLMVLVKDYEGFDLALLGDRDTFASKFGAIGKIRRYAVVGAPTWMRSVVRAMGPLIPIEMRTFDASEEGAARAWAREA